MYDGCFKTSSLVVGCGCFSGVVVFLFLIDDFKRSVAIAAFLDADLGAVLLLEGSEGGGF